MFSCSAYLLRCGLCGGDRANGEQKQSHFQPQTNASHSSDSWPRNSRNMDAPRVARRRLPTTCRLGSGRQAAAVCAASFGSGTHRLLVRVGAAASEAAVTQAVPPRASPGSPIRSAGCGVVTETKPHVRNVMGVQFRRAQLLLRTELWLDGSVQLGRSWPINDRCVWWVGPAWWALHSESWCHREEKKKLKLISNIRKLTRSNNSIWVQGLFSAPITNK